jgi:uncharacterized MAPEG superfamily protein
MLDDRLMRLQLPPLQQRPTAAVQLDRLQQPAHSLSFARNPRTRPSLCVSVHFARNRREAARVLAAASAMAATRGAQSPALVSWSMLFLCALAFRPAVVTVDSLEPDAKGLNLLVKVLEVFHQAPGQGANANANANNAKKRFVTHVLVADSTGSIELAIQGASQANTARQGSWLYVRNAHVAMTSTGHMRLTAALPWAILEAVPAANAPPADAPVNKDNNLSLTEYELVGEGGAADAPAAAAAQ